MGAADYRNTKLRVNSSRTAS